MSARLIASSGATALRPVFRWRGASLLGLRPFSADSPTSSSSSSSSSSASASASASAPSLSTPVGAQQHHEQHPLLSVAIVGRPNVGKSTLFNRLTKSKLAIVTEVPGTTRDRKEAKGQLGDLEFNIIDTGGLDDRGSVCIDIQKHVHTAVQHSHLVLFMVDAKEGLTALDTHFATWLRRSVGRLTKEDEIKREIVCVVNKTEGAALESPIVLTTLSEVLELGFGDPILISAIHGDGISDLASLFFSACDRRSIPYEVPKRFDAHMGALCDPHVYQIGKEESKIPVEDRVIQVSIMGRPNVGKSTLLNAILGEERVIVGPTPGLTRDSIHVEWKYDDRTFKLVDTAGLTRVRIRKDNLIADKKNISVSNKIGYEKIVLPGIRAFHREDKIMYPDEDPSQFSYQISELALQSALNSLKYAQVVLLVVEGEQGQFSKVDLQLARRVLQEGRSLVIAANKSDVMIQKLSISLEEYSEGVKRHCDNYLREFGSVPVFACSALENKGIDVILDAVKVTHDAWSKRISTWVLNAWLKELFISFPPPRVGDKQLKVKYVTQLKARPPSFAFFCNTNKFPGFYSRFLQSKIQEDFNLEGIPLRFVIRKSEGTEVKKHLLKQGAKSNYRKGHNLGMGVGKVRRQKGGLGTFLKTKRKMDARKVRRKEHKFDKTKARSRKTTKTRVSYKRPT